MTIAKTSYPATQASTPVSNIREDSTTAENYYPTHQKSGNSGVHAGQNTCFWIRIEEPEGIDIDQLIISFVPPSYRHGNLYPWPVFHAVLSIYGFCSEIGFQESFP